jgi:hypothetical protein
MSDKVPAVPLSRRDFCAAGALGLSVGAAACRPSSERAAGPNAGAGSFEVPLEARRAREMSLTRAVFAREAGTRFTVSAGSAAAVEAQLAEVKDLGPAIRGTFPRGEVFELVFVAGAGPALAQGTYTAEHPRLGRFDLFVVPVDPPAAGGAPGGRRYSATFNRI